VLHRNPTIELGEEFFALLHKTEYLQGKFCNCREEQEENQRVWITES